MININKIIKDIIFIIFISISTKFEIIFDKSSEKIVDPIKPIKKPKKEDISLKNPFKNPLINPKVSRQIIIISK